MDHQAQSDTTCTSSDGSNSSNSDMRLKEKIENRRSILNQLDDGKIRRKEINNKLDEVERTLNATARADYQRFKASDSQLAIVMSPSTSDNLKFLREVTSKSISRSRQRKVDAENRLMDLFSSARRSSGSFDTRGDDKSSITHTKSGSSEENSQNLNPPKINRKLFGSEESPLQENENNLVRPKPRKATSVLGEHSNLLTDIGNLGISGGHSTLDIKKDARSQTKEHYSQQMNISVMDNFFVFKL